MKCLLLGNGPLDPTDLPGADLPGADLIVQFNLCVHRDRVPPRARRLVFISNTGAPALETAAFLETHRDHPALRGAGIIAARNPLFYGLKRQYLRARRDPLWIDYELFPVIARLKARAVGFGFSLGLDHALRRQGMARGQMPSTGMIAWRWLPAQLPRNATFMLRGFNWQGWPGHPWQVERGMMAGTESAFF